MTQAADDRDHQRASDRPGITKGNRMHNLDRATCGDLPPTQAHAMVHWQDYLQGYAAAHYAGPARGSAPPGVTGNNHRDRMVTVSVSGNGRSNDSE